MAKIGTLRTIWVVPAVIAAFEASAIVAADPDASWIGVTVLPKSGAQIKLLNDGDSLQQLYYPFIVQDVASDQLLVGRSIKGWVRRADVVTLDEAVPYYSELIRRDPTDVWAFTLRACAREGRGELNLALADYTECLRLKPSVVAYTNRSIILRTTRQLDRAIADCNEALRLKPDHVLAFHHRGVAEEYKGDYDRALDDFTSALDLDPTLTWSYFHRGLVWKIKKEFEQAIADFDDVIRLDPSDARAFVHRGIAWSKRKKYPKALADFNEAVRLRPHDDFICNASAWFLATCPGRQLPRRKAGG
jgi:tetratricopeptide (TPR) repeat protein